VQAEAGLAQAGGEHRGEAVDARGDGAQALRAVIDGVEAGEVGQQHLRGADVGVRLFAADVLLTGLQRHAQRGLATRVLGDADDTAGHRAHVAFAGREEGGMRAAEAHRHAEALRRTERDVGAHGAGALEQHQGHQIAGDRDHGALGLEFGDRGREVDDLAACVRVLQQRAEAVVAASLGSLAVDQLVAEVVRTGAHHVDGLREAGLVDEEHVRFRLRYAPGHRHRLGGGGGFVEQRGVGELQAGEVDHHLLVVQQGFEAALGDLGLVGRVGGVPARVLEHVAQHDRGDVGAVVALTDQGFFHHVAAGDGLQAGKRLVLGHRAGERQRRREADAGGHGLRDQGVDVGDADARAHAPDLARIGAEVAVDEGVALLEAGERGGKQGVGHGQAWAISAS